MGRIEDIVAQQIRDGMTVYAKEASLAEAKRIMGLRAVFGEVFVLPAVFYRMVASDCDLFPLILDIVWTAMRLRLLREF